ncbi:MAG: TolC family protein, partial [Parachlamydiaceae bacterium]
MLIFIFLLAVESLSAIDFDSARIRALQHPMLDSSEGMIGSRYYQYNQSGALANPEFSVTVEGFGKNGGGGNWGNNNNEVTYTLSQLIETAGKRTYRQNIAAFEWLKACLMDSLKRRSFLLKFSNDFFMTSFYEERIKIQEEKIALTKEKIVALEESVKLGKARAYDLRLEKQRLRLDELELLNRKHEWQLSHKAVESSLCSELDDCGGAIYKEPSEIDCTIEENPLLEIVSVEREILYLSYGLEKAKQIPNFILSGGYSSTFDNKQTSYLIEIDMPIPIFDQNQGAIRSASIEIERKDNEYQGLLKALSA